MKIEHVALYVKDLEGARKFFEKYFCAKSGGLYHNRTSDFKSYFLTFDGGASRYNPVMLLKVMVYCYMTGIYSSRQIAKQCRENVNVMWLTGFQKPDFRTINTFRSEKLKDSIEEIFVSTVRLLNRKGYVSLEKYFVDGTKIYKIHLNIKKAALFEVC